MMVLTQPFHHVQGLTQGQFSSGVNPVLNSEFSFSLTGWLIKGKEPSLRWYLSIGWSEQMDSCLSQGY